MYTIFKLFRLAICALLALISTPGLSYAQTRVVVYADEANYASEQAMSYEARCPSGRYRFRINQNDSRVELDLNADAQQNVDLTSTTFGKTFLDRALQGKFYATCPGNGGIRLYFYGVEPSVSNALRPVKYAITFGVDGAIVHDGEVVDESPGGINRAFLYKAKQ